MLARRSGEGQSSKSEVRPCKQTVAVSAVASHGIAGNRPKIVPVSAAPSGEDPFEPSASRAVS
jgi:hypothetical protein